MSGPAVLAPAGSVDGRAAFLDEDAGRPRDGLAMQDAPRSVAVFRALQLGDWLCATPALAALRAAWPGARIDVAGLPSTRELMRRLAGQGLVDDFIEFPGIPEFPEQPARGAAALRAFLATMRGRDYDLALQMHGSGGQSNPIVAGFGARRWAGFVPSARLAQPGRLMAWPDRLPEPRRYLALLRFLGLPARDEALRLPLGPGDHEQAALLAERHGLDPARTVLLHPGARLPSRRWPAGRFAALARALAADGWQTALTGSGDERAITAEVAAAGPPGLVDLTGQTTLGVLGALLARVRLLVCNDTGVSHVAAAVRTPSVVVASGSDAARWAPLDGRLHRVLALPIPCRPCAHSVCPIGHPCALGVTVAQARAQADALLAAGGPGIAAREVAGLAAPRRRPAGRLAGAPAHPAGMPASRRRAAR